MAKPRNSKVESRNVRLNIETYKQLDKYLVELIAQKGKRLALNDAVEALLNEHYQKSD